MSTLPPMWPHFFSEASWSSQCTPAAPAAIIDFISSNALSTPPKPGLGVGHDRREPVRRAVRSFCDSAQVIWSARSSALLMRRTTAGTSCRVQALVRVGLAGQVGVGGDLPAGQVDGRGRP